VLSRHVGDPCGSLLTKDQSNFSDRNEISTSLWIHLQAGFSSAERKSQMGIESTDVYTEKKREAKMETAAQFITTFLFYQKLN
jgi:hypothetical protein